MNSLNSPSPSSPPPAEGARKERGIWGDLFEVLNFMKQGRSQPHRVLPKGKNSDINFYFIEYFHSFVPKNTLYHNKIIKILPFSASTTSQPGMIQMRISPFYSVVLTKIVSFMDISSHSSKYQHLPDLKLFSWVQGHQNNILIWV